MKKPTIRFSINPFVYGLVLSLLLIHESIATGGQGIMFTPLCIPVLSLAFVAWPGFRGIHRDGIISGISIATDWSAMPPDAIWRRPVGPGCSSFAIAGDYFFTQGKLYTMGATAAISVHPATGKTLWEYAWPIEDRILQPAWIEGNDLLLTREYNELRRVSVSGTDDGFAISERWTSARLQVNFNDHVIHNGYAYVFDGPYLACIDLKDGKRLWKGERYRGWILLLVRNSEEMAAFRLPPGNR